MADTTRVVRIVVDASGAQQGSSQVTSALERIDRQRQRTQSGLQALAAANASASARMIAGMSAVNDASLRMVEGMSRAGRAAAMLDAGAVRMRGSVGLASFQVLQLSQQVQDFGIQVAGGQNPLVALAQQGSQAAFIMGGFGASIAAVRSGVVALTRAVLANPLLIAGSVVAAGIAAAATAFFAFGDSTERAASAQQRLTETLDTANRLMEEAEEIARRRKQSRQEEIRDSIAQAEALLAEAEAAIVARREQLAKLLTTTPARGPAGSPVLTVEIERLTNAADAAKGEIDALKGRLAALGTESTSTATKVRDLNDIVGDLASQRPAIAAKEYADAVKLIERTIESGLTDQERYEQQVLAVNRALMLAAENGFQLSAENAERLNRALKEADPAFRAAKEAAEKAQRERERMAEQEAEILRKPFENALEGIQDSFTDFFEDVFRGGIDSFKDLASGIKGIFVRLAAEIAALLVFRPVVAGILGGVGLGSIAGGMGLMPTGGLPGGVGIGDLFGVGKEFLGSGSGIGQWLFGAAQNGKILPTSGILGSGGQFLGSTFLADAFLPFLGSALPGLISGNFGQAAFGGGGALLGTAIGGPIGGVVGGLLGNLVGGLFGGKKKTPQAVTSFDLGGGLTEWTRAGGNIGATNELAKGIADTVAGVVEQLGGTLSSNAMGGYILTSTGKNQGTIFLGGVGQYGSGGKTLNDIIGSTADAIKADPNAVAEAVAVAVIRENARIGAIAGLSATQAQVLRRTDASSLQALNADLAFAQWYEQVTGLAPETTQAAEAIKALNQQFREAKDRAAELGLDVSKLTTAHADALVKLTTDFNQANEDFILGVRDPLALALKEFEKYADQQRKEAADLGADLVLLEQRLSVQRQQIVEQSASGLRRLFDDLTFGSLGGASPTNALSGARASFEAAVAQGNVSGIETYGRSFVELSRQVNASGSAFQADRERVLGVLGQYLNPSANTNVAAAQTAQATTEMSFTLKEMLRVQQAQAQEIAALRAAAQQQAAAVEQQNARLDRVVQAPLRVGQSSRSK